MPMFYFRPLDFHADKREKNPLIETDFNLKATMLYIVIGIVMFVLFIAFVIGPTLEVIDQIGL